MRYFAVAKLRLSLRCHYDVGAIVAFEYVLVNVFNGSDRGHDFYVNVSIVFEAQVRTIGNDSPIIHKHISDLCLLSRASTIEWISIQIRDSVGVERFGKLFCALAIIHALSLRFVSATWSMHHASKNNVMQSGVCDS